MRHREKYRGHLHWFEVICLHKYNRVYNYIALIYSFFRISMELSPGIVSYIIHAKGIAIQQRTQTEGGMACAIKNRQCETK
jgi:hypothetical protein